MCKPVFLSIPFPPFLPFAGRAVHAELHTPPSASWPMRTRSPISYRRGRSKATQTFFFPLPAVPPSPSGGPLAQPDEVRILQGVGSEAADGLVQHGLGGLVDADAGHAEDAAERGEDVAQHGAPRQDVAWPRDADLDVAPVRGRVREELVFRLALCPPPARGFLQSRGPCLFTWGGGLFQHAYPHHHVLGKRARRLRRVPRRAVAAHVEEAQRARGAGGAQGREPRERAVVAHALHGAGLHPARLDGRHGHGPAHTRSRSVMPCRPPPNRGGKRARSYQMQASAPARARSTSAGYSPS